jgi:hypothetical protein
MQHEARVMDRTIPIGPNVETAISVAENARAAAASAAPIYLLNIKDCFSAEESMSRTF